MLLQCHHCVSPTVLMQQKLQELLCIIQCTVVVLRDRHRQLSTAVTLTLMQRSSFPPVHQLGTPTPPNRQTTEDNRSNEWLCVVVVASKEAVGAARCR